VQVQLQVQELPPLVLQQVLLQVLRHLILLQQLRHMMYH
jgi:hypothetical protein